MFGRSGRPAMGAHMSAFGTKRTWPFALHMSAFGGKADIDQPTTNRDLRYYSRNMGKTLRSPLSACVPTKALSMPVGGPWDN